LNRSFTMLTENPDLMLNPVDDCSDGSLSHNVKTITRATIMPKISVNSL
jgi:hypothetical protein